MNQREDIPAAQPCPVSQPEQQPPAQPDDEIEWTNVMNELDAIFLDPVVAPLQYNRTELLRLTRYEEDGATCQLCRLQKDQSTRTLLSVFPKADKCAIHMRTCAAMPYDMCIARVRLSGSSPAYAEHACPHCGTKFTTSKGCNSHANQCRKRREKCGLSWYMSLAPHLIRCCTIVISRGMFWLRVAAQV